MQKLWIILCISVSLVHAEEAYLHIKELKEEILPHQVNNQIDRGYDILWSILIAQSQEICKKPGPKPLPEEECKKCKKECKSRYYEKNYIVLKKKRKEQYALNTDKINQRQYRANRTIEQKNRIKAYLNSYYRNNIEYFKENYKQKSKIKKALEHAISTVHTPKFTELAIQEILEHQRISSQKQKRGKADCAQTNIIEYQQYHPKDQVCNIKIEQQYSSSQNDNVQMSEFDGSEKASYYQKNKGKPGFLENKRERERAYYHQKSEDPAFRKQYCKISKKIYDKKKEEDPNFLASLREKRKKNCSNLTIQAIEARRIQYRKRKKKYQEKKKAEKMKIFADKQHEINALPKLEKRVRAHDAENPYSERAPSAFKRFRGEDF